MMESSRSFCPVPLEQQPINEYENLKESGLFRWATLDLPVYRQKLAWIWFWGAVFASPIAAASFPPTKNPFLFVLSSGLGATLGVLLLLMRMLLGWYYIRDRLNAEQISYEESGWYDGQTWPKPPEVLTRDRLIVSYQIDPIVKRLQGTAIFFGSFLAIIGLIWLILWKIPTFLG